MGCKRNAKGHSAFWIGYKLHLDVADGSIPVSCILTSASVLDNEAAFPLATMTSERVCSLYHVMDSACDAKEIRGHSLSLGHVPIIDPNPRRSAERKQEKIREAKARRCIGFTYPEARHFAERSTAERVNGRLKDELGARHLRVRGHAQGIVPSHVWSSGIDREPAHQTADLIPRSLFSSRRSPGLCPGGTGSLSPMAWQLAPIRAGRHAEMLETVLQQQKNTSTASQNLPCPAQRSIKLPTAGVLQEAL